MKNINATDNFLYEKGYKKYEINLIYRYSAMTIRIKQKILKKNDIVFESSFKYPYFQKVEEEDFSSMPGYTNFLHKIEKNDFGFEESSIEVPKPKSKNNEKIKIDVINLIFKWDYINKNEPIKLVVQKVEDNSNKKEK